jgi:hypothetical protein
MVARCVSSPHCAMYQYSAEDLWKRKRFTTPRVDAVARATTFTRSRSADKAMMKARARTARR